MNIPVLDLKPQYRAHKEEMSEAIARVLESGQFILGPDVRLLEEEVATYLGVKHAIGVNSGTDALIIGLRAAGIGKGDEVIATPFSFFATAESISNVGAKPIFADIDPKSYNIDPEEIKAKITPQTKGIMPVHLYGRPAAMGQIMDIAHQYGLKVIEDCAQSFGARYGAKYTGTIGHVGAFSFFPSKNLGAYGDGGMIVTDDNQMADLARMLRVHGTIRRYQNEMLGYNSRLDSIQAAILRVKLKYIDEWNEARRKVAKNYNRLLAGVSGIIIPEVVEDHVFNQYTIRFTNGKRDRVKEYLASIGISSMIYYPVSQNQLPVYKGQYPALRWSDLLAGEVLSLPIWPEIEEKTMSIVVQGIKKGLLQN